MRSIKAIKFIVLIITVSAFGLLAFTGCFDKPESKAQRQLDESTLAALDKVREGLSGTAGDESEDVDRLQQAKDNLASAISKNQKAPDTSGAIFAKGNISFAQAQKLHSLLQTKSVPVTKAANQILIISDQIDALTFQGKRLQDMVDSNGKQISQLQMIIDGDIDNVGIRKELDQSNAELTSFVDQKIKLEIRFNKAQGLGSNLQNQANAKLQLAEAAAGDEKVKLSTEGLNLQRRSNAAMIQAQSLSNEIELHKSNITVATPLNEKLKKDMSQITEQIASLNNSPDFIKLKGELRNITGPVGQLTASQTELSTAIGTLTAARSDYVKESEKVIALLTAAIEDYETVRSGELGSAAAERIATSYFWIGSVCVENVTLAKHAKSIAECIPESTSGSSRIVGSCDSDTELYAKKAFENYDLASEKYGQVNPSSDRECYIIKQQILTLYGKSELTKAIAESDISGWTAVVPEDILEKVKQCDPDFSKTLLARLIEGRTGDIPVLAVDNTSYYEDIRKLYQENRWPKLPVDDREEAVNKLLADLVALEIEDTFDRQAYERVLGPEKLKLENAIKRGFEDFGDDTDTGIADPNF